MKKWGHVFTTGRSNPQELVKKIQKSLKIISTEPLAQDKKDQELKHIRYDIIQYESVVWLILLYPLCNKLKLFAFFLI